MNTGFPSWDIHGSMRLKKFVYTHPGVFGIKWSQQVGHWVPTIIFYKDVYMTPNNQQVYYHEGDEWVRTLYE
jgi:hypothetical protein